MAYTSMVMTESAFYPVFATAVMLMVLALVRRAMLPQILVFAAAVVCFETRVQGAVVVAAYLAAVVLVLILDALRPLSGDRASGLRAALRAFAPTWVITIVGVVALGVYLEVLGRGIPSLLGAYGIAAEQQDRYQAKPIISWFVLHIAELDLWVGVVPVIALLVLVGSAISRVADPAMRAFACVAVPTILLMTVLVSAFVVFANVGRIEDRNLFYVGFLPLIALCWWAQRSFDRPQPRWFVVAVGSAAIGPAALPYGTLLNQAAVSDTFGIFVPFAIQSRLQDPTLTMALVAVGTIVAITLLATVAVTRPAIMVLAVAAFLTVTAVAVDRRTDKAAAAAVSISQPQSWIDQAVGADADVAVLYPGGTEPMRVWQAEFFNRSVRRVLTIGVPLAGNLPETVVNVAADGAVENRDGFRESAQYVLTDSLTAVDGRVVARDPRYGMVLLETGGPLTAYGTATGIYGDGWSGPDVVYTRHACPGGVVTMEASVNASIHPTPVTVTPYVGDVALAPTSVDASVGSVPVRAAVEAVDGVCQVRFNVTPVVAPSAAIGSVDTRPLGVIVRSFGFEPGG
jgi:hypothetical protein